MSDVNLPAVLESTIPVLDQLTKALNVPRGILASDEEIQTAWSNLPGVLKKIPAALRTEGMVRMCVAIASGLFDSAINYIWNASVIELREKVKRFGLPVVAQITGKNAFDEDALVDFKDAELLSLCLKLNLITEDGFFFLDQCRDIRNNFSAAHPVVGKIDDHEFIGFANRCAKYALGNEQNPVGVDLSAFVIAIKSGKFSDQQREQWAHRIQKTHDAQQYLIFGSLHGMYSDPTSNEEARVNALSIAADFSTKFAPKVQSDLINRHHDYIAKGDEQRHKASQQFFEKLGMLALLGEHEIHSLMSNACKRLLGVHQSYDNFYNEPPFAERLLQLAQQTAVPNTVKPEFVETVVTAGTGNQYGVSNAALGAYEKMIKGFSPSEVEIMLGLPQANGIIGARLNAYASCRDRFKKLVALIDPSSVPAKAAGAYAFWTK
ncbi:hypothetical protein KPL74_10950 [Bacillus sp. NP157]|nr:hypothetical protein KPL74_10950 [Bacillus sp. NP157]